jgi:hypothetical protein
MADPLAAKEALSAAKNIQALASAASSPPDEGFASGTQHIVAMSVVKGTRGYIERVANQVNGCYERGWFDSCAVMIRRLIETLIIEAFEKYGIASKIQTADGDFVFLRDLISRALAEPTWNLGRNAKAALPRLKDIGDKSAHSRRFKAHKNDIEKLVDDVRVVVQEFVYLAGLK